MRKNINEDCKILTYIILGFIFVAWLCTPPGNKFLQICFWNNNVRMFIASFSDNYNTNEYKFHRKNAVYLAKMYPKNKKMALEEMNKAIKTIPSFASEEDHKNLYIERAHINMFYGNYSAALNDYIRVKDIPSNDYLNFALLLNNAGKKRLAERYCNNILNNNVLAYAGYACLSEIYLTAGKPEISVKVWDLAIDRKKTNPCFYRDRAKAKLAAGDITGYNEDIAKAKSIDKYLDMDTSIIEETMHPKHLDI